jgi:hypothetical protein
VTLAKWREMREEERVRLALVRSVQANVATLSYAEVRELDAKLAEIQRRRG